jgi:hypothetical protein
MCDASKSLASLTNLTTLFSLRADYAANRGILITIYRNLIIADERADWPYPDSVASYDAGIMSICLS